MRCVITILSTPNSTLRKKASRLKVYSEMTWTQPIDPRIHHDSSARKKANQRLYSRTGYPLGVCCSLCTRDSIDKMFGREDSPRLCAEESPVQRGIGEKSRCRRKWKSHIYRLHEELTVFGSYAIFRVRAPDQDRWFMCTASFLFANGEIALRQRGDVRERGRKVRRWVGCFVKLICCSRIWYK